MGKTTLAIDGEDFFINGRITYEGREYGGRRVEGLLMNSRMVQAIFDDLNPETRSRFDYPDGRWDAERNTNEFCKALPVYYEHGLRAVTINLQGGSPQGYSEEQPWINSAFDAEGALRPAYVERAERVLNTCDQIGMVVIVGLFYFGQDERLKDESAVRTAVINAVNWLARGGWTNVMIEIANEIDVPRYEHEIICPDRCHELIVLARERSDGRFPVGTSWAGGTVPSERIVAASDIILLHGNGVKEPNGIRNQVDATRAVPSFKGQPILFNEDDHFNFHQPDNNMLAAVDRHASWGLFDYRMRGEGFEQGFQNPPVDWGINSARKKGFFTLLKELTSG